MKVWLIRLDMAVTLDDCPPGRFSEPALLSRRAHPRHRPAGRHEQRGALAREARAVLRGRLADDRAKRATEGAQAVEAHVEADLGDRTRGLAQQLHRTLHAAALQVAVRRLAERGAELAAEMRRGYVGDARERLHIERRGERAIDRVAGAKHATVAVLCCSRHPSSVGDGPRAATA